MAAYAEPGRPAGNSAASNAVPIAELEDVSKTFGATRALQRVSLQVAPGQTHALLGRNGAGKSTAVSILTGLLRPDQGAIRFSGSPAPSHSDAAAWPDHVACLYQHSTLIPALTVTENLFVDRFSARGPRRVDWPALRREANELLAEWELDVSPNDVVENLNFEHRQLVEIARALSKGSRFIIMDEPTAQLDTHEIERLFATVRRFQQRGISFLYISHFLREVFEICDHATVMRDGQVVLSSPVSQVSEDGLVHAMVGENAPVHVARRSGAADRTATDAVLQIHRLELDGAFAPLDLEVRGGEIVGIAGSARSGASAVGEVLAGLRRPTSGGFSVKGATAPLGRVDRAIEAGIGYVPQDRHAQGIVPQLSVAENLTMTVTRRLGRAGLISPSARDRLADDLIARYAVKIGYREDPVDGLSGGNQQKVVVGRAVASEPCVLVLDTPTAGVDIASTATLFEAVGQAASSGLAVLIISNTISELRLCDTVRVMFDGSLTKTFAAGWAEPDMVAAIEGVEHA